MTTVRQIDKKDHLVCGGRAPKRHVEDAAGVWQQGPAAELTDGTLATAPRREPPSELVGHSDAARGGMPAWHMPPHVVEAGLELEIPAGRPRVHGSSR
jgi:hypothetical protein